MKSVSKLRKVLLATMYLIFTSCINQSTNDLNKKLTGFDDKKQMDTNNKIPKKNIKNLSTVIFLTGQLETLWMR